MNYFSAVLIALLALAGAIFLVEKNNEETSVPKEKADYKAEETDESIEKTENGSEDQKSVLDLSGQNLKKAPSYIFNKTNVEVLDLSHNSIDGSLQAEVRYMQNLRVLNLSDNNFTGVPAEVGQLTRLEVLDLSNNPLTGLPYEIGNLKNLRTLDLRGTNYALQDLEVIQSKLSSDTEIKVD